MVKVCLCAYMNQYITSLICVYVVICILLEGCYWHRFHLLNDITASFKYDCLSTLYINAVILVILLQMAEIIYVKVFCYCKCNGFAKYLHKHQRVRHLHYRELFTSCYQIALIKFWMTLGDDNQ